MPDKLTALRIKQQDGTYSAQIPVGALAENVAYNSSYSVRNVLGNVEMSKGSVQEQLNSFDNKIGTQVSEWLEENVQMASGVDIDQTLTVAGQAADAQAAGKLLTVDNESTVSATKFKVTTTTQTYNLLTDEDIDATLTQAGVPADAKVAGDEITDLKSALNNNVDGILNGVRELNVTWENGGFYTSSGKKNVASSAAYQYANRTVNKFKGDGKTYTINNYVGTKTNNPQTWIFQYSTDSDDSYIKGGVVYIQGNGATYTFDTEKYYNIEYVDSNSVARPPLTDLSIYTDFEIRYVPNAVNNELTDLYNRVNSEIGNNNNGVLSSTKDLFVIWENGNFYTGTGGKNSESASNYAYSSRSKYSFKGDNRNYKFYMPSNGPTVQIYKYNLDGSYIASSTHLISGNGGEFTFSSDYLYNIAFLDVNLTQKPSINDLSIITDFEIKYIPSVTESVLNVEAYDLIQFFELARGGIDNNGEYYSHNNRMYTKNYIDVSNIMKLMCTIASKYALFAYGYNENKTYIADSKVVYYGGARVIDVSNWTYARFMFLKDESGAVIPFEDITKYTINGSYELKDRLDKLDYLHNIPEYWKSYLPSKINTIQAHMDECALSGDGQIFITDYHIENNAGLSHYLAKYIVDNTSIKDVVFGGDAFNGNASKAVSYNNLKTFAERFSIIERFYFLRGNHEFNLNDGGSKTVQLSDSEIYNLAMKRCEHLVEGNPGNLYYYRDNKKQHIRYIHLDARYENDSDVIDDAQLAWMQNKITELDESWSVVIFSHQLFGATNNSYTPSGQKIVNALGTAKETARATIPCIISGHKHKDDSALVDGTWFICTGCDTMQSYATGTRTKGTTTEQLFDVFSFETAGEVGDRKIYATRIGYGNDREWSY